MAGTDGREARPLIVRLVYAIADAEGTDPTELNVCLHDFISPEALGRLYVHEGSDWELEFTVREHTVEVDSDGDVRVDGNLYRLKR